MSPKAAVNDKVIRHDGAQELWIPAWFWRSWWCPLLSCQKVEQKKCVRMCVHVRRFVCGVPPGSASQHLLMMSVSFDYFVTRKSPLKRVIGCMPVSSLNLIQTNWKNRHRKMNVNASCSSFFSFFFHQLNIYASKVVHHMFIPHEEQKYWV